MKDLNYDMKAYLRIIYNSAAYQRAAYTKDVELGEVYHFPGPVLRRMSCGANLGQHGRALQARIPMRRA
jgi:hypothetical protein